MITNVFNDSLFDRKSPPSPLSPGQQKRVRFLVDNNDQSGTVISMKTMIKIDCLSFIVVDEHQSSILFRQGGIGGRGVNISAFDEMENSRRITSNVLFGNTSSSYDFGLMTQTGIDQSADGANVSNNNFTFIQTTQRTKYQLEFDLA